MPMSPMHPAPHLEAVKNAKKGRHREQNDWSEDNNEGVKDFETQRSAEFAKIKGTFDA
jgi:hypothetical protein